MYESTKRTKKYLVVGGTVNGGYISPPQLAKLYNVNVGECVLVTSFSDISTALQGWTEEEKAELLVLQPLDSGNYQTYLQRLIGERTIQKAEQLARALRMQQQKEYKERYQLWQNETGEARKQYAAMLVEFCQRYNFQCPLNATRDSQGVLPASDSQSSKSDTAPAAYKMMSFGYLNAKLPTVKQIEWEKATFPSEQISNVDNVTGSTSINTAINTEVIAANIAADQEKWERQLRERVESAKAVNTISIVEQYADLLRRAANARRLNLSALTTPAYQALEKFRRIYPVIDNEQENIYKQLLRNWHEAIRQRLPFDDIADCMTALNTFEANFAPGRDATNLQIRTQYMQACYRWQASEGQNDLAIIRDLEKRYTDVIGLQRIGMESISAPTLSLFDSSLQDILTKAQAGDERAYAELLRMQASADTSEVAMAAANLEIGRFSEKYKDSGTIQETYRELLRMWHTAIRTRSSANYTASCRVALNAYESRYVLKVIPDVAGIRKQYELRCQMWLTDMSASNADQVTRLETNWGAAFGLVDIGVGGLVVSQGFYEKYEKPLQRYTKLKLRLRQ